MLERNPFQLAAIRMAGLEVALHRDAGEAYGLWSAIPRLLPLGDLPPAALAALFAVRTMIVIPEAERLSVVGGFSAFRIWCQLDAIRHRPEWTNVLQVNDEAALIAGVVEAEMLCGIADGADGNPGTALLDYLGQLPPASRELVIGSDRVTKGRVAGLTQRDRRRLQRTKALVSPSDSDILAKLLAKF